MTWFPASQLYQDLESAECFRATQLVSPLPRLYPSPFFDFSSLWAEWLWRWPDGEGFMEAQGCAGWLGHEEKELVRIGQNLVWGPENCVAREHQLWFPAPFPILKISSWLGRCFSQ